MFSISFPRLMATFLKTGFWKSEPPPHLMEKNLGTENKTRCRDISRVYEARKGKQNKKEVIQSCWLMKNKRMLNRRKAEYRVEYEQNWRRGTERQKQYVRKTYPWRQWHFSKEVLGAWDSQKHDPSQPILPTREHNIIYP